MAIVKRTSIYQAYPEQYKSFFDGLDNPMIVASVVGQGFYLTVDDSLVLYMNMDDAYKNYIRWPVNVTCNGSTSADLGTIGARPATITVVHSDTLVFLNIVGDQYSGIELSVLYEKTGGSAFYGYSNTKGVDIRNISLTKIGTPDVYTRKQVLAYSTPMGAVNYLDYDILFAGGYADMNDTNFLACSTLTKGKVYTFDGQNYFSIGTNTLVVMDN